MTTSNIAIARAAAAAVTLCVGLAGAAVAQSRIIDPKLVVRPAGTQPFATEPAKLLADGTARHGDAALSPAGRSCNTCHAQEDS